MVAGSLAAARTSSLIANVVRIADVASLVAPFDITHQSSYISNPADSWERFQEKVSPPELAP